MTEFDKAFLSRHGEIVLTPILEAWERAQGIKYPVTVSFDYRWFAFLQANPQEAIAA